MIFGRGLCIEFLFLRHGLLILDSCAGFRLSQGRAKDDNKNYCAGRSFSIRTLKVLTKDSASSTHGLASASLKTKKSS
jgi:hypothetical protein